MGIVVGDKGEVSTRPMLGVTGGACLTFLLVLLLFLAKLRLGASPAPPVDDMKVPPSTFHVKTALAKFSADERDPDVIPAKFG